MDAKEFVEKMKELTPPKEYFVGEGLSEEDIILFQQMFQGEQINAGDSSSNALFDLVENYDTSTLEIGLVRFGINIPEPKETDRFWRVGYVEADWLAIDRKTLQIKVEQHDQDDYELWICAENSERFLDALYGAAGFIFSPDRTPFKNCQQAKICADLTGGNEYLDFYKMLLLCPN